MKNLGPSCPRYVFVFFTRSNGYGSICHEPLPITDLFTFHFRWREGVPTSILGSQPIIWLLSSSSWCPATWVRLPSTNIWSPLCDLHSFLTLWRLDIVNSNTRSSNFISLLPVGYHVTIFIFWFGLVWFGLVLWHIHHCWLFNAKSCFYIYI